MVNSTDLLYNSFWHVKLQALTTIGDFEGLDTFSKSKRSPIGYEPFVRHLVEKGHTREALSYVARCDSPKRADLYVECGDWRLAGKECKERGDKAKLEYVLAMYIVCPLLIVCPNRELRKKCPNSMIARELAQIASSMR